MSDLAPVNDINLKVFDEILEEQFSKIDVKSVLVTIIDNAPSDALPHLAEQYHITGNEGWIHAKTENEKRSLIKSAIKIHRYKGTKFALQELFKTLNLNGQIYEWFNYGGEPYHFKVDFNLQKFFDENFEKELLDLINENKNVRSVLEALIIYLYNKKRLVFANAVITFEEITV